MNNIKRIVLILTICLLSFSGCVDNQEVFIDKEKSFFSNFIICEDKVKITCEVTLCNNSDIEQTVNLIAFLPEDEGKLLKNKKVSAIENDKLANFVIPANSVVTFSNVTFLGEYGGTSIKANKLLPHIEVILNEEA